VYERTLAALGCEVRSLPAEPELPDSVFVEDVAVVFDELAILARLGAESRRAEVASVAKALEPYRKPAYIEAPGTLDGGDVLTVGRRVFVGLSRRTNRSGIEQLGKLLAPHGYSVESVPVERCLHLKSAVTQVAEGWLLINPAWVERQAFREFALVEVDPSEPFAANALLVNGAVVYPAAYARTRRRLEEKAIRVVPVEVSELAKAEGGVTCCSLILKP
ncbi:MAG: dimethylarginine dimethylaminohydrolase family protein, partial [Terriglobales bacterium]